jgi:hypothetical protein
MKSQDIMDQESNRAEAIKELINFCLEHNLNYSYTDKAFSVVLPGYEKVPNEVEQNVVKGKVRKGFDIKAWGPKGVDEANLPDPEKPLDEGTPPEGQI